MLLVVALPHVVRAKKTKEGEVNTLVGMTKYKGKKHHRHEGKHETGGTSTGEEERFATDDAPPMVRTDTDKAAEGWRQLEVPHPVTSHASHGKAMMMMCMYVSVVRHKSSPF